MDQLLIKNARLILEKGVVPGGVLLRGERIAQIIRGHDYPSGFGSTEVVDLAGDHLAAGFLDIHIHGSDGVEVLEADRGALRRLSEFLLRQGVTGYFATLVPTDDGGYRRAVEEISAYANEQPSGLGARILGIHFEGPFVNENRCGALRSKFFRTYDGDTRSLDLFTPDTAPDVRLITLAPEILGGLDLTAELVRRGVRVFIGHSQADVETLDAAAERGARHITHFPNALDPLHHRRPGAVGWGLVRGDITMDCIADFHHVAPLMLQLMYQSKGPARLALISDAILATGLGDGQFQVWGETIRVTQGRTSLAGSSAGTIAGSVITMRQAVKNILSLGVPLHQAVHMASAVPAQVAGLDQELGSIEEGKRADLISFDDGLNLKLALVGGVLLTL